MTLSTLQTSSLSDLSDLSGLDQLDDLTALPDPDQAAVMLRRQARLIARRAFGEAKLLVLLGATDLEPGNVYHFLSGGDIDSLTYLKHVINQQPLDYCLFSTWRMALDDVLQFEEWLAAGRIKHLDAYVGEIFPNSYRHQYVKLCEVIRNTGGRVCVFRNHAKIFAGIGSKYAFGIESSANINTNPRTENTVISIGADIYEFYKQFFDGIKSFNRDFDDWTPYGAA